VAPAAVVGQDDGPSLADVSAAPASGTPVSPAVLESAGGAPSAGDVDSLSDPDPDVDESCAVLPS
jgi:hypothetical protein